MKKHGSIWPGALMTVLVLALLAASGGGSAAASSIKKPTSTAKVALNVPVQGSGGFNYTQGSYLEGFEFSAKSPISITKLGAYDSNLSSLANGSETFATVPVAVYDLTSHKQVAEAAVSASDPATGVYRYATLPRPVKLVTTHRYAVVWVSLTNFYVASPTLVATDVNPALHYLAMVGYGPGGLTMSSTMVMPDWFFTLSAHGLAAINYDLGPNFIFKTSG